MNPHPTSLCAHDASRFPGALSAIIVGLFFGACFVVPTLSGALGTYLLGFGSCAVIYYGLKVKYHGNIPFNAEVTLIAGICIQYLAAPALLRLVSNDFAFFLDQPITAERMEVKEAYCDALLIVLGFVAAYLAASSVFGVKRLPREASGKLILSFSESSLWFVCLLAIVLWGARVALLKTGSYYHLNRSDFQFDDWRYSMLAQIDSILGVLVLGYLFSRYLSMKGAALWPVAIYLGADLLWNFASGSRERGLTVVIVLVLTFILCRNRFPLKFVVPVFIGSLFLIGFMDFYRYASLSSADASKIEVKGIHSDLTFAKSEANANGFMTTAIWGLARLSDLESIAGIARWVPHGIEHTKGETYLSIASGLVPRAFWHDKPPLIIPLNNWIYVNEGGSSPITIMGEGYLNFGWAGVLVSGLICGILVPLTEGFLLKRSTRTLFFAFYLWFLIDLARLHTQCAGVWVSILVKTILFFFSSSAFVRLFESREPLNSSSANSKPEYTGKIKQTEIPLETVNGISNA